MANEWAKWLGGGSPPSARGNWQTLSGHTSLAGNVAPKIPANVRPNLSNPSGDQAGSGGFGKLGTSLPKAWYKDIPAMAFNEFIGEGGSDWFRREYAASKGLGEQTEKALSRFSPVGRYWLSALGQDEKFSLSQPNAPQRQADLNTQFYDRLLGPNTGAIDPKAIMQKVVGSVWNGKEPGKNDYLSNLISNPELDPGSQISNFWSYVNGTVGRLMPPSSMDSYKSLIQREGNLFTDFLAKNPTVSMTFPGWVKQRLGPTGGL